MSESFKASDIDASLARAGIIELPDGKSFQAYDIDALASLGIIKFPDGKSFQVSDIDALASLGIKENPDGTFTRDPTRYPRVPATPEHLKVVSKDICVNHSKSTWMRLYVPTTALNGRVSSKKLPLVVYYHGGGFITYSFDLEMVHDFCNLMALKLNVVVASASYRLAPENKLPAAYEDGVDAVEWLRNSEDECIKSHADLSNVFLMGTDSGGNMAYNVGLIATARVLTPLSIRGLILDQPFFGGEALFWSELGYAKDEDLGELCWRLCLPVGADRDHEYSNPRVGYGPKIIKEMGWKVMVTGIVGDGDDRQIDIANLMKENGVDVIEHFTEGVPDVSTYRSFIYSSVP